MSSDYCCWKDSFNYLLLCNIFQLTDKTKLLSTNDNAMNACKVFEALTVYLTNKILGLVAGLLTADDIQLVYVTADTISTTCQSMLKNAAAKVKHGFIIYFIIYIYLSFMLQKHAL
jgi:hypothetical protein